MKTRTYSWCEDCDFFADDPKHAAKADRHTKAEEHVTHSVTVPA